MITELIHALQAGEELKNKETWKNVQATTSAIGALAGAALMVAHLLGLKIDLTAEQIGAIAGGIATVMGLFNGYTTVATSASVGLRTGGRDTPKAGVAAEPFGNNGS